MNRLTLWIIFQILLLTATTADAATTNGNKESQTPTTSISAPKDVIDQLMKNEIKQGHAETPQLRKQITDNYINRQLLALEASKLGLDKTTEVRVQLEQLKTNFLATLFLKDYFNKHPISETDLKTEFDMQSINFKKFGDPQQFKLSFILVDTLDKANDLLARIKKGESFTQIAKDNSIDKGKNGDGTIDWVLASEVMPQVSNVMVNLPKGAVSAGPIQAPLGWYIIKVEDKRPFKIPTFEESRVNIEARLIQKRQGEIIQELRKSNKISN